MPQKPFLTRKGISHYISLLLRTPAALHKHWPMFKNLTCVVLLSLYCCLACRHSETGEERTAIRQTLTDWNDAIKTRNATAAMSVFDNDSSIVFSGSGTAELFRGPEQIRGFLHRFFQLPYTLSWDLKDVAVDQKGETAWAFADGNGTITAADNTETVVPYRIAVVMVKHGGKWKWRLFSGSIPGKD
jgi:uncharacterized protein (TIGR02246 family)